MLRIVTLIISIFFICIPLELSAQEKAVPKSGEGVALFLKRFNRTKRQHYVQFLELNKSRLGKNNGLKMGVEYILPSLTVENREPLFGDELAKFTVESNELDGAVFYLVSGHGGPDPGAIGILDGKQLHEDEYAYDIILRLARCMLSKGAKVHLIIQDAVDGIRDDRFLANSDRETCMGEAIPLNQVERLKQRCNKINALSGNTSKYSRAIFVHLDSRSKSKQIDVFFYYSEASEKGKRLANTLRNTFDKKYDRHQPNRGFSGTISSRDLYVLRNTTPVSVFMELGNIQNEKDQKRFLLKENRQALANWICEGIVQDYRYYNKKK